jgi:hypothetical protein
MEKNRNGCLFRPPFLWFISFGGAKEMNKNALGEQKMNVIILAKPKGANSVKLTQRQ